MEDQILQLSEATIVYLRAKPEYLPRKYLFTGTTLIMSPSTESYTDFMKIKRSLLELNRSVRVDIVPTSIAPEVFMQHTLSLHQYISDDKIVHLHEQHISDLVGGLPADTKTVVNEKFQQLFRIASQQNKRPSRKSFYAIFSVGSTTEQIEGVKKTIKDLFPSGESITLRSQTTGLTEEYYKHELPWLLTQVFVVLASQTTYFQREIAKVFIESDQKKVLLQPRYLDKVEKMSRLNELYSFILLDDSNVKVRKIPEVVNSSSWKGLKETNFQIGLFSMDELQKKARTIISKFISKWNLTGIDSRMHELSRSSPNGVFCFAKVQTCGECTRIYRTIVDKSQPKPQLFQQSAYVKRNSDELPKMTRISSEPEPSVRPRPPEVPKAPQQPKATYIQPDTYSAARAPRPITIRPVSQTFFLSTTKKAYEHLKANIKDFEEKYGKLECYKSKFKYPDADLKDAQQIRKKLMYEQSEGQEPSANYQGYYILARTKDLKDALHDQLFQLSRQQPPKPQRVQPQRVQPERVQPEPEITRKSPAVQIAQQPKPEEYFKNVETSMILNHPDLIQPDESQDIDEMMRQTSELRDDDDDYFPPEDDDDDEDPESPPQPPRQAPQLQPSFSKLNRTNPFNITQIKESRQFPVIAVMEANLQRYIKKSQDLGLILNQDRGKFKVEGPTPSYTKLATLVLEDNKYWCEAERSKRPQPTKRMSYIDDEDVERIIEFRLDDGYKFVDADREAKWAESVLDLSQRNTVVEFKWMFQTGNDAWKNDMLRTGIKGHQYELHSDLRKIRALTGLGYVMLCKGLKCRSLQESNILKLTEDGKHAYRKANMALPVYIGKLQY